jgi:hypothetical protein
LFARTVFARWLNDCFIFDSRSAISLKSFSITLQVSRRR